MADRPDSFARKGSNLYVTVRHSAQLARIKTQTGSARNTSMSRHRPQRVMRFKDRPHMFRIMGSPTWDGPESSSPPRICSNSVGGDCARLTAKSSQ